MRAIYIVKGINGGEYRGIGLLQDGTSITPYESTHSRLGVVEQAYTKTANNIMPQMLNDCEDDLTIYTNNNELASIISDSKLNKEDKNITMVNYKYNKYNHNDKWQTVNELWRIATLIGFDDRYMCQPEKPPEPPYTVYTDASLWDDYDKASVGFVVLGSNGGMYSAGFPTPDKIQDNNIAECYAILSALQSLPKNAIVEINTDSKYAHNQMKYIQNQTNDNVMGDIRKELKRFKDNPIVQHVSRELTCMPDMLAGICKDDTLIIGNNPRDCFN